LVGGALITLFGWRSIFLVNLPIGLTGLWLTLRFAHETTALLERKVDLPGQTAATVALGALAGALIEGGALGWDYRLVTALFWVAALAGCSSGAKRARRSRCCRCRCSAIACSR
jgi:MFS transporter, DHA2 family, methylenomycin A resistance protein